MNRLTALFCTAAMILWSGASFAQGTGSEGYFQIYNNTANNVVIGFYTNDGSGWSDNWLDVDLEPGENSRAEFFADTGNCDQVFQVGWLGEDDSEVLDDPINIDICTASNVYLDDNEIYFD
ncbi:hypothetical protein E1180_12440 [Roseibium denhamense]|uniref:Uncharacterized protein n=1 Tax=Roseibium denhamense TaxID=76305 RepID=A0ABY1NFG8_9HYPH|nr:hypothetical protein [Roseibium denhamense]MTI06324.1 hypothetical protein [Roseibium denhamense]SMP08267.1 hypothetical protein SAMN06265374_0950 [Roseibium denhamense]